MRCVICKKGETREGYVTVTLEREGVAIVFQNVPAQICENCGEEYVSAEVTGRLMKMAEEAVNSGVSFEVRRYAA
jgi:YgiT-type zinc finger domain-containing protein